MRKNKKPNKLKVIIVIILTLLALAITVFGRYIYNSARESYLAAKQFYFSSNILTVNGSSYEYNNWGGKNVYPIKFDLYSYENNISKLNYELDYTVTCSTKDTDKIKCGINSEKDNAPTTFDGTIDPLNNNTSTVIVYVTPINVQKNDSVTIEITASTTKPYKKTISCEITLNAETEGTSTYSVEDIINRDYAILKLTCPSVGTTVTLTIDPTKLRIDSNDEVYLNSEEIGTDETGIYVTKVVFKMPSETTKYVKFYKVDKTQNYTYPGFAGKHPIKVTI